MKRTLALLFVPLLALSVQVAVARPAMASGSSGSGSNQYDLRVIEDEGSPSGPQFQIAVGQKAYFTAWVNSVGDTTQGTAVPFDTLADKITPNGSGQVYLKLWYGWSPQCATFGPGYAQDGCETETSYPPYYNACNGSGCPTIKTWQIPTLEPAPAGTETLYYDVQLYTYINGQSSLYLQAAAGAIVLDLNGLNEVMDSPQYLNESVFSVPDGAVLDVQTCLTTQDTDNCINPLDVSNFLNDYQYICSVPQGAYKDPTGAPVKGVYIEGSATQLLTYPHLTYSPPPGQSWTFKFYGFVSKQDGLGSPNSPGPCPPSSNDYISSDNGATISDPLPIMEITWDGPTTPSVGLAAVPQQAAPGQQVMLAASYLEPDGASYLYICARSGTSWLQFPPGATSPYVLEQAIPPGAQGSYMTTISATAQGTAQFIAFLSTDSPGSLKTCPSGSSTGTYGTHYSGDWSNYVNVTWAVQPSVTITAIYDGQSWTDQAPSTDAKSGQIVTLQGNATGLVPLGGDQSYYMYICSPSSPLPPASELTLSSTPPYADAGTPTYPPYGSDWGAAEVSQNTSQVTIDFVAFVSTDPDYEGLTNGDVTGPVTCPTTPNGLPGSPDNVLAVSQQIPVTWDAGSSNVGQWYPD